MTGAARPVVLFDWGDTLIWIPGMIHDADRHLACVAGIFDAHIRPRLHAAGAGLDVSHYISRYLQACQTQIDASRRTLIEHRFADRFSLSFEYAGAATRPPEAEFDAMADALGDAIASEARVLDHTAEVIPQLAAGHRLGLISNYPHAPVVRRTLDRFGLSRYFDSVVVSAETGWMKPHAQCYQPALRALEADHTRTLMVGDDFRNDVQGARAMGLHAAWLAPGKTKPVAQDNDFFHLQSLAELPAICQSLFDR
jgi:HAD superfamily hydrolase (TIGR01509 family)